MWRTDGRLAAVTVVGVLGWLTTRCDLELRLWNDLVHGVCTSSEDLACVAVAGEREVSWVVVFKK